MPAARTSNKPMDLNTIQQQFKQVLLTGEYGGLSAEICAASEADKQARLDIYRNNVSGSCLKVMEQIYSVCKRVLGETIFLRSARGYGLTYPSRCNDLNTYGDQFAEFLDLLCQQESALRAFAFVPDLARLEWATHRAYDSPRDPVFDYHALQQVPTDQYQKIVFLLSASLVPLTSAYSIFTTWQKSTAGLPNRRTQYLCVYRRGQRPMVAVIDKADYQLLKQIAAGSTLAELSAMFPSLDALLAKLIQKQWVCGFQMTDT